MTTAGTPALNRPAPDRSESQRRCEEALKVAKDTTALAANQASYSQAAQTLARGMGRIASILEDR